MRLNYANSRRKGAQAGFTLIEMSVVLLIIAIMTALAIPSFSRYRMGEQTRESSQVIATALRQARASSLKDGVQHFVIFNPNIPPSNPGTIVRLVRDVDGDWQETAVDLGTDYFLNPGTHQDIQPYGMGATTPFSANGPVPGDPGGALSTLTEGASFPNDPNTGRPAVGFTAQGVPVDLNTPTSWGTGAGAFYMTDGTAAVYAAVVGPLGEVRVRALNPGTGEWN
jgi:prepilin-type N-terminal cleavage/methylation domain-containing protein